MSRPLLVVHGKNDPNVPLSESDQMVNRLRSKGGQVWFLLAANEGSEFTQQNDRVGYYEAFASFLNSLH
jgi:dipeptidyl aminopeptidase/acylaminoacyl peptidase